MEPLAKKVLLIDWDAADWKVATPLMDQGLMPTLNALRSTARCGRSGLTRAFLISTCGLATFIFS
jgi:hypothetical protein